MKSFLLAILCLFSTPAFSQEWTTRDTAYEAAYLTLLAADWAQTLKIVESQQQSPFVNSSNARGNIHTTSSYEAPVYQEMNPLLGRTPSRGRVNTTIALTAIGHVAVARMLSPKYRRIFQALSIGVESYAVGRNYKMGIRIKF